MLVRMMCEEDISGFIYNMELYAVEGMKLENTVLSVLDKYVGQNHHVHGATI
jgi:hypothetical protein